LTSLASVFAHHARRFDIRWQVFSTAPRRLQAPLSDLHYDPSFNNFSLKSPYILNHQPHSHLHERACSPLSSLSRGPITHVLLSPFLGFHSFNAHSIFVQNLSNTHSTQLAKHLLLFDQNDNVQQFSIVSNHSSLLNSTATENCTNTNTNPCLSICNTTDNPSLSFQNSPSQMPGSTALESSILDSSTR
jgi:hypothetical protein